MRRELPNRIRELRKARGMSEEALADQLKWQKTKVHRLETGTTVLRLDDMRAIALVMGLKPSELLNDGDVEYRSGENERIVRSALADLAVEDRQLFLNLCSELTRIIRRSSARHASVSLQGSPNSVRELAELWNDMDDPARSRTLEFLRSAIALQTPPRRGAMMAAE